MTNTLPSNVIMSFLNNANLIDKLMVPTLGKTQSRTQEENGYEDGKRI